MNRFNIPNELVPRLRELQKEDSEYKITVSEDAVVMFYGMGDPLYLTFDGRVIIEDWMNNTPPREAGTLTEAACAVVVGAKVRNFPELLSILPKRPPNAFDCGNCNKSGWFQPLEILGPFVCGTCGGLGWLL
jgi:hypothetical protein